MNPRTLYRLDPDGGRVPLALSLLTLAALSCAAFRNGIAEVTPTVPPVASCADGAMRCAEGVPQACRSYDDKPRWWPLTPLSMDAGPARCSEACIVSGDPPVAHCAAFTDASVDQ